MTRDHDRHGIVGARRADGPHCARVADRGGHRSVALAVAVADLTQMLDDVAAETLPRVAGPPAPSKTVRRLAKYSSICRATVSSRAGARSTRGVIRSASPVSTAS